MSNEFARHIAARTKWNRAATRCNEMRDGEKCIHAMIKRGREHLRRRAIVSCEYADRKAAAVANDR